MAAEVQAALTDYPAAVEDIETAYAALQQGAVVAEPNALQLWDGQTGHSIQALTRWEALWKRPYFLKATVAFNLWYPLAHHRVSSLDSNRLRLTHLR